MLSIFLENKLSENQYGHRSGKSAAGAWRRILELWETKSYIYEFDFRGFHDEITRHAVVRALTNLGVSKE